MCQVIWMKYLNNILYEQNKNKMLHESYFLVISWAIFGCAVCHDIISSGSHSMMAIPRKPCKIPATNDLHYLNLDGDRLDPKKDVIDGSGHHAVEIMCFDRWKESRASDLVICFDGEWFPSDHTCVSRTCRPLYDTYSTTFSCITREGIEVSCELPAVPGTRVIIQCVHWRFAMTEKFVGDLPNQLERMCPKSRDWEDLDECSVKQNCGNVLNIKPSSILPNNNMSTVLHEYPWHVIIYHLKDNKFNKVCGGTILSILTILTAADCILKNKIVLPASELKIGVGKYYADFSSAEPSSRIYHVAQVYTSPELTIAVLAVSEYIEYSDTVGELCHFIAHSGLYVAHEKIGHIAAWRVDETGSITRVGKTLEYVSNPKCTTALNRTGEEIREKLLADQFCTSYTDDTKFVPLDIGGAIVNKDSYGAFYITGVLSALFSNGEIPIFTDLLNQRNLKFYVESRDSFYSNLDNYDKNWFKRRKDKQHH